MPSFRGGVMPIGDRSTWGPALRDAAERPAWWFRGDLAAGDGPGDETPPDPGTGDPPGGDPPKPDETDPPGDETPPEDEAGLSDAVKAVLAKERQARKDADKRARDAAKEARDAKEALAAKETAELSELEQAQKRAEDAEAERDEARKAARVAAIRAAVHTESVKLNLHDPVVAARLLDEQAIEFDQDGSPSNVGALLTKLAKDHPYLVKKAGGHIEETPADGGKPPTDKEIREKAQGRLHTARL